MKELQQYAQNHGIPLTDPMLEQFARYEGLLLDWNSRMNLTAITDHKEVVVKHFLDSLLLLEAYPFPEGASLLDMGTGAGFPGIPLKIARPDLEVTLVDSLRKRVGFLVAVGEELGLSQVTYLHSRAEDLAASPEHREGYDLVTARAVAALPALLEYCLPFVRVGGSFLAMKGGEVTEEISSAREALKILGGVMEAQHSVSLPDGSGRTLLVVGKASQTPRKYPRKAVKITKKPL